MPLFACVLHAFFSGSFVIFAQQARSPVQPAPPLVLPLDDPPEDDDADALAHAGAWHFELQSCVPSVHWRQALSGIPQLDRHEVSLHSHLFVHENHVAQAPPVKSPLL